MYIKGWLNFGQVQCGASGRITSLVFARDADDMRILRLSQRTTSVSYLYRLTHICVCAWTWICVRWHNYPNVWMFCRSRTRPTTMCDRLRFGTCVLYIRTNTLPYVLWSVYTIRLFHMNTKMHKHCSIWACLCFYTSGIVLSVVFDDFNPKRCYYIFIYIQSYTFGLLFTTVTPFWFMSLAFGAEK